ncbi:hypothetical protein TraAM80_08774 [Trypanosoma rangeli]|uniref:Mucin-associated surface protein (MASP) n=1 Tax=Trypanosoma rangeli TaxID=5698 RepID=A0A422MZC9_TRYRA|nr:uncharacterized protein TraAM80_08774 [Trypanosoma rangeli]RNE98547.1 hypothetical protein TraAM80_08774 [Trypanosoma rangeli]|eukprot:RNE98547.1 hypothetical protein TraAM80_08774 [Trypanosoma rangeli]
MAGRVLLVCALCVLCCAAGGAGAWGSGYCTESDWKDLRVVAEDMTEAEVEGKHCSHKPEPLGGMRASVQKDEGEGEEEETNARDGNGASGEEDTDVNEGDLLTDDGKNGKATDEGPPAKGSGGTSHTPPLGNRKTQYGGVGQTHSPPYSETPPPPKPTANGRGEREGKDGPPGDADSTRDQSEHGPAELAEPERTKRAEIPPRRGSLPSSPEEEQPPLPSRPEEGRGSSTDVSQGETNAGKEGHLADDNGSATQRPSHVPEKGRMRNRQRKETQSRDTKATLYTHNRTRRALKIS